MQDFRIFYTDKDGDHCKVWVSANDKEHAKEVARDEYWDIDTIDQVVPM